jgi:cobalamin biosynthesis protein CobW
VGALPVLAVPGPLVAAQRGLVAAHDMLGVKGFGAVAGKPLRLVLHGVGPRLESHFDRAFLPGEVRETRLVVIGEEGLDEAAIVGALRRAVE